MKQEKSLALRQCSSSTNYAFMAKSQLLQKPQDPPQVFSKFRDGWYTLTTVFLQMVFGELAPSLCVCLSLAQYILS